MPMNKCLSAIAVSGSILVAVQTLFENDSTHDGFVIVENDST